MIVAILAVALFLVTELFETERAQRNKRFWIKVGIIILIIVLNNLYNTYDDISKLKRQRKDVKLSILDDFKNNCRVIYTWKTCLNQDWTPTMHIIATMNKFELINLLNDKSLKNDISETYKLLLDAEKRIKPFRTKEGFENQSPQEKDAMQRYIKTCLDQLKYSIKTLNDNLFARRREIEPEFQKSTILTDEQIITLYMDYGNAASGDAATITSPAKGVQEE